MSIHIEDLTVRFKNGVTAINHANLNIPNGIFGLLGENGAGKTTLMRVLTTVLKPTNGTVTLDGILYSEGNYEKIQRKIEKTLAFCIKICYDISKSEKGSRVHMISPDFFVFYF